MSTIKKVEFTYKKSKLRYDSAAKKWIGYQIDIRVNGNRHRDTFATKREAELFIDTLRAKKVYSKAGLQAPGNGTVLLSDLLAKRLTLIVNQKEKTRAIRIFREFESLFNMKPSVRDVRAANFQTYINNRLETGVKPETVNREITVLRTAFVTAPITFPEQLDDFEPPRIPRPKFNRRKRHKRVITDVEKDAIVRSILNDRLGREYSQRTLSRPNTARMFELAWILGLRFSEVDRLRKSDFNAKAKTLLVTRWKTNTTDLIEYLPDRALELLKAAESTTERMFERFCSEHTFADIIQKACEANGIEYGRSGQNSVTFHSTRHSFTTRMMRVTDMATTQSFTGHSDKEMVALYAHADPESRRKAMERMYGGDFLKDIFEQVRDGKLSYDKFKELLQ